MLSKFWFAHGLLALIVQAVIAGLLFLLGLPLWNALLVGASFVVGAYVGRERKTVEEATGRNTPLWNWRGNPKAAQDIGLPFVVVTIPVVLAFIVSLA